MSDCVLSCYMNINGTIAAVFFQAEDGIRDLGRSRGLGDVYKRQVTDPEVRIVVLVVHCFFLLSLSQYGDLHLGQFLGLSLIHI